MLDIFKNEFGFNRFPKMVNNENATAWVDVANDGESGHNSFVATKDAQVDSPITRSKKNCFMATLSMLEKSSFAPFRELIESIYVWIDSQASYMHRGQHRVDTLAGYIISEFLYSDVVLQKRSNTK